MEQNNENNTNQKIIKQLTTIKIVLEIVFLIEVGFLFIYVVVAFSGKTFADSWNNVAELVRDYANGVVGSLLVTLTVLNVVNNIKSMFYKRLIAELKLNNSALSHDVEFKNMNGI